MVFVDLIKEYDTIDIPRLLKILKVYGVGDRIYASLTSYWEQHKKYVGKGVLWTDFLLRMMCYTGDMVSPTLFNILINSVVRNCIETIPYRLTS